MKQDLEKIVKSALMSVLALSTLAAYSNQALAAEDPPERCYGIVKAGMNDCPTATTSCAGTAKKDSQPDAFVLLPKGTCNKIVGGSLQPKK